MLSFLEIFKLKHILGNTMRLMLILFCMMSPRLFADVIWDLPIKEIGRIDGRTYAMNLNVGDKSRIKSDVVFCTSNDGLLMLDGLSLVGEGEVVIKILDNRKAELTVSDMEDFLSELAWSESFARCEWWTSHKGKYVVPIDNINGKKSIMELIKPAP
jgi:hypothetical protein